MSHRWQKRYYLLFILPALLLGILVSIIFYSLFTNSFNQKILQQAHTEASAKTAVLHTMIDDASRLLKVLAGNPVLSSWLTGGFASKESTPVDSLFRALMDASATSTQLRFIDTEGNERIRINRDHVGAESYAVASDALQNKAQRYYFTQSMALAPGQYWVSPLDLNIEHGVIERPLNPVVRISTPVDIDGVRYGILILNAFIQPVLEQLANSSNYYVYIVDKEGEFLLHKNPLYNWSRYLGTGSALSAFFPDEAPSILQHADYRGGNINAYNLDIPNGEGLKLLLELKSSVQNDNRQTALMIAFFIAFAIIVSILPLINARIIKRSNLLADELDRRLRTELDSCRRKDNLLLQQSKMAMMGEMLSMIAHQWRQPLATIAAIVARLLVRNSLNTLQKEDIDKACNTINDMTQYLSNTIDDFRNFFRPKQQRETVSVSELFDKAVQMLGSLFDASGITLSTEHTTQRRVDTYANELLQVLLNLIKNAADAFADESPRHKAIMLGTAYDKGMVVITVHDTGSGIPEQFQAKIFEPYFTTKEQSSGTGLGLYMSKVIVEDHLNGTLSFQSGSEGTTFTVTLPALPEAAEK